MPIRMAQYGTGHGHAAGKMRAMRINPDVEVVGIYDPDPAERERSHMVRDFQGLHWFDSAEQMLADGSIEAIAIEGRNDQGLAMAQAAIAADKHLWYDKPGGDDWPGYQRLVAETRRRGKHLQMGYMLRYHDAFRQVADWARTGFLGQVYSVRANMTTHIKVEGRNGRAVVSRHRGGIFYDLGGHMLDQLVWILGRPRHVSAFLRNDATPELPGFADNALGVFAFERALGIVDIAAIGAGGRAPKPRRFEVHGTEGTASLMEPFEPGGRIWLALADAKGGHQAGQQIVEVGGPERQALYERELAAFVRVLRGEQEPDRSSEHELLVQETLLRTTGGIPGN